MGEVALQDVVAARLGDRTEEIAKRIADSPYPFALVLSESRVVLGRVAASDLKASPDGPVDEVMDPGPKTDRPHKPAEGIAAELAARDLRWVTVTTPHGVLVGVVSRDQLEAAVKSKE